MVLPFGVLERGFEVIDAGPRQREVYSHGALSIRRIDRIYARWE